MIIFFIVLIAAVVCIVLYKRGIFNSISENINIPYAEYNKMVKELKIIYENYQFNLDEKSSNSYNAKIVATEFDNMVKGLLKK